MTLVLERDSLTSGSPAHPAAVRVRPMTSADAAALDQTFAGMSERSRFLRYHSATPRLTPRMRRALLDIDGRRHVARVAEVDAPAGPQAIGIARLLGTGDGRAEVAVEVVDAWQRQGVGTLLVSSLYDEAHRLGYVEIQAEVLPENRGMHRLLARLGAGAVTAHPGATLWLPELPELVGASRR